MCIVCMCLSAQTIDKLTLDEKVGQLFIMDIRSKFLTVHDDDYKNMIWAIKKYHIGGVILFGGHTLATAQQLNEFQQASDIPLLVSTDLERGVFQQFPDGIQFPPNMAIGATKNTDYAYLQGKITAKEAKALGIHMIFAPVLDVNNNPYNPIINFRSYSDNPKRVADMGSAFIRGVQNEGLLATAKHFPGHGDTSEDSHSELPKVEIDMERFTSVELFPFEQAIKDSVSALMVGHIALPLLHQGKETPATTSSLLLTDLLRKKLQYNGILISDAFNMDAVTEDDIISSINAGMDIILMPRNLGVAIQKVKEAVKAGIISEQTLNTAVARILNVKKSLGLFQNKTVSISQIKHVLEDPEHIRIAEKMAEDALTVFPKHKSIQLNPEKRVVNITVSSEESLESPGKTFYKELKKSFSNIQRIIVDLRTTEAQLPHLLNELKEDDQIIVSLFSRTRAGKGSVAIDSVQHAFVSKLLKKRSAICVTFGSPYIASDFSFIDTHVFAYSYSVLMQKATAKMLSGEIKPKGILPVQIPNINQVIQLEQLDSLVYSAIEDSVFPGASILIGTSKNILYQKSYGRFTYQPNSRKVLKHTLFDLASLTKAFATTFAIMKLVDDGELLLETPLSDIFSDLKDPKKKRITVGQLLSHSSGMLWHKKFYETVSSKEDILRAVETEPLVTEPGTKMRYSDLGFITLMQVVEEVSGEPFEDFIQDEIYHLLDIQTLVFNPKPRLRKYIPPTEKGFFHKTLAQGVVHDGNTAAMGGISGHAGLFGNTVALSKLCQLMLNDGRYKNEIIIRPEVLDLFTRKATDLGVRGFGWDKPSGYSSAGKYISDMAYGHLGFTGTSVWIDPKHDVYIILLSNRVYPTRTNKKIRHFRPLFHNRVMELLRKTEYRASYKEKLKEISWQF